MERKLPLILFSLVWVFFALAYVFPVIPAADTWMHVASGNYLLSQLFKHGFFGVGVISDPFSYTTVGLPWLNHQWLGQIFFSLITNYFSFSSLYFFRSFIVIVAFWLLPFLSFLHQQKSSKPLLLERLCYVHFGLAIVLFCCFCSQGQFFFDVRCYLFTYLFLSFLLFIISIYEHNMASESLAQLSNAKFSLLLLASFVFFCFWANCHGGFIVGLIVLALWAMLAPNHGLIPRLWRFFLLLTAVLACLINPFGIKLLAFSCSFLGKSVYSIGLSEWQPPTFWAILLLILLSGMFIMAFKQLNCFERVMGGAFLLGAFFVWRHAPLAALLMAFLLPCSLWKQLNGLTVFINYFKNSIFLRFLLTIVASCLLLLSTLNIFQTFAFAAPARWSGESKFFCPSAVAFIKANPQLPKAIFNPYEWGGYLDYQLFPKGYKTFIDGRANTLFSQITYSQAMSTQYGRVWNEYLLENGLHNMAILTPSRKGNLQLNKDHLLLVSKLQGDLYNYLINDSEWTLIYEDHNSAIFLARALAQKLSPYTYPLTVDRLYAQAEKAFAQDNYSQTLLCLSQALQRDKNFLPAYLLKALVYLRTNDEKNGLKYLLRAHIVDPHAPFVFYNLALLAKHHNYRLLGEWLLFCELRRNPNYLEVKRNYLES